MSLLEFQKRIGYTFQDETWLVRALTHKSFMNESSGKVKNDNQVLEFLGDSVLSLAISSILVEMLPGESEGVLSKTRASVVKDDTLYLVATSLGIGNELRMGKGEESTGGRNKVSILAATLEAVIGAVYLDSSFDNAKRVVNHLYTPILSEVTRGGSHPTIKVDYKTELQEYVQAEFKMAPTYRVISQTGSSQNAKFCVQVFLDKKIIGEGIGKNKKEAEQQAAKDALSKIKKTTL